MTDRLRRDLGLLHRRIALSVAEVTVLGLTLPRLSLPILAIGFWGTLFGVAGYYYSGGSGLSKSFFRRSAEVCLLDTATQSWIPVPNSLSWSGRGKGGSLNREATTAEKQE